MRGIRIPYPGNSAHHRTASPEQPQASLSNSHLQPLSPPGCVTSRLCHLPGPGISRDIPGITAWSSEWDPPGRGRDQNGNFLLFLLEIPGGIG